MKSAYEQGYSDYFTYGENPFSYEEDYQNWRLWCEGNHEAYCVEEGK